MERHAAHTGGSHASASKLIAAAAGLICVAQAGSAYAQEEQSFKTLLGKGFEIKNVTFAHGESTDNRDAFLVTLQKDKSIAVAISPP